MASMLIGTKKNIVVLMLSPPCAFRHGQPCLPARSVLQARFSRGSRAQQLKRAKCRTWLRLRNAMRDRWVGARCCTALPTESGPGKEAAGRRRLEPAFAESEHFDCRRRR